MTAADLTVVGRLGDASNAVFLVQTDDDTVGPGHAIYKPIRGERPLWDFPDGHLAHREVAAYLISRAAGWDLVPATVLREGPFGPGSVQAWVSAVDDGPAPPDSPAPPDIVIAPAGQVPPGYLPVVRGRLPDGTPVQVAHADSPDLASMAVLDAVLNNSDRKGSHVLRDPNGRLWGVDHGVSLHVEDKLRTVLWGWQGEPIRSADRDRLDQLVAPLARGGALRETLTPLLTGAEIEALTQRVATLRRTRKYPLPPSDWPSLPWPPV